MASYVLSNSLARFTFIDHATTGLQLYSFARAGSAQIWLNADTRIWNAKTFDTTASTPFTAVALTPSAGDLDPVSVSTDDDGSYIAATWSTIAIGSGDTLNVVVTLRLNNDEDFLRATVSASWNGTPTRYTLDSIGVLPLKIDPLNEGTDVAVMPAVFGIISRNPITNLQYSNGVSGFPDTGWNLQTTNRWTYPSGRGWPMGVWGYYDTSDSEGWMLHVEDHSLEYFYGTFESDGTRMTWLVEQPQQDNVLVGNNGRTLGSGYTFCLRAFRATTKHGWWDIGRFYRERIRANPPEFYVPNRNVRDDLSDEEKAYSVFIDLNVNESAPTLGGGEPGDLTALTQSVLDNCGAPDGTALWGMVETDPVWNLDKIGEDETNDLAGKLRTLYARGDTYLGQWVPAETHIDSRVYSVSRWDQTVGDSAELRFWTNNDCTGRLRMSRAGYLAGGGSDRLAENITGRFYRERTYPIVSWTVGTLTLVVTGTPASDGFTGSQIAVLIPASGAARLAEAEVSSLSGSNVVVSSVFLDGTGATVTPTAADTVVIFNSAQGGENGTCWHAAVNADSYFDRIKTNTTRGMQAAWNSCGGYLDTHSEPTLQSSLSGRTGCYRDHTTWSKIDGGYVNHPKGGGDYHKRALKQYVSEVKQIARDAQSIAGREKFFHMSCEDIEETMHGEYDWCWHDLAAGNLWRVTEVGGAFCDPSIHGYLTVPLYGVVYSGQVRGRALLREFSSILGYDSAPYNDAQLHAEVAYWMASDWPYGLTLPTFSMISFDGFPIIDLWDNTIYVSGGGAVSNTVKSIRDLWSQMISVESNWPVDGEFRFGEMMAPATIDLAQTSTTTGLAQGTYTGDSNYYTYDTIYDRDAFPRVTHSVWKGSDNVVRVLFVNWTDTAGSWSGVVDIDTAGLGAPGSILASRISSRRLNHLFAESGSVQFDYVTGRVTLSSVAAFTVTIVELSAGSGGMATIVKGSTITSTVTAGGLHALVESATISGIERGSVRASEISLASLSTSEPASPSDNEVWQNSPGNTLATYDTATTSWLGSMPMVKQYTLRGSTDAAAGNVLAQGQTVNGSLSELELVVATGASSAKIVGVALAACSVGSKSVCVTKGPAKAKTTGTINAGEGVKLSSTDGVVQSAGAVGSGQGWEVFAHAITAASGGFSWISL